MIAYHQHRRRGSAMSEMVLALPLILLVLSLLFYLGRGVVRVQRAQVMDRYESWRIIASSPGPQHDNSTNNAHMNQLFFGDRAAAIDYQGRWGFPIQATEQWIEIAGQYSNGAADLAEQQVSRGSSGVSVVFTTEHSTSNRLWSRFEGPIRHRHTRFGNDWAYVNGWRVDADNQWEPAGPYGPNLLQSVHTVHIQPADDALIDLAEQNNVLARAIRNLYLAQPGYVGPDVDYGTAPPAAPAP